MRSTAVLPMANWNMRTADTLFGSAYSGVNSFHHGDDYVVSLKEPPQCADIAAALGELAEDWLRKRYFALVPEDYGRDLTEEDFEYTLHWLSGLASFYNKAAPVRLSVTSQSIVEHCKSRTGSAGIKLHPIDKCGLNSAIHSSWA